MEQLLTLRGQQAVTRGNHAFLLCKFQNGLVAKVVLLGGLDTEGPLCPHARHCLEHIKGAKLLQLCQADVQ